MDSPKQRQSQWQRRRRLPSVAGGQAGLMVAAAALGMSLLLCSVVPVAVAATVRHPGDEDLVGWGGERQKGLRGTPRKKSSTLATTTSKNSSKSARSLTEGSSGGGSGEREIIRLSWRPRAYLYKNFLSHEECDHLVNTARPMMEKSQVVDSSTGKSVPSDIRTSSGTFLNRGQDKVVKRIESKIANWTMLPEENGEGIQILRYEIGQKYDSHYDWFSDKFNTQHGGQRAATVLMYLTDVEEGGETVFPTAKVGTGNTKAVLPDTGPGGWKWSPCAKKGIAARPLKGDAILFWSVHPDGKEDYDSLHGGCPVIKGEKWSATKWLHVEAFGFGYASDDVAAGDCADKDENCREWAALGECDNNPKFMLGDHGNDGVCVKSCDKCPTADA